MKNLVFAACAAGLVLSGCSSANSERVGGYSSVPSRPVTATVTYERPPAVRKTSHPSTHTLPNVSTLVVSGTEVYGHQGRICANPKPITIEKPSIKEYMALKDLAEKAPLGTLVSRQTSYGQLDMRMTHGPHDLTQASQQYAFTVAGEASMALDQKRVCVCVIRQIESRKVGLLACQLPHSGQWRYVMTRKRVAS